MLLNKSVLGAALVAVVLSLSACGSSSNGDRARMGMRLKGFELIEIVCCRRIKTKANSFLLCSHNDVLRMDHPTWKIKRLKHTEV